jgi:hypothetical protein
MKTMTTISPSREWAPRYEFGVQFSPRGLELLVVDMAASWWRFWRRAVRRFPLEREQVVLLYQELHKYGTRQMILQSETPTPAEEFADDVRRTLVEMYADEGRAAKVSATPVLVGAPEHDEVLRLDAEFIADFLAQKGYRKR